jgi:hypothetical protein
MNKELKNVVSTFGKTSNVIYFIKHPHPKRKLSFICKQGGINRVIKKNDKDDFLYRLVQYSTEPVVLVLSCKTTISKTIKKSISSNLFGSS